MKHHRYAAEHLPEDAPILLGYAKAVEGMLRTKGDASLSAALQDCHRDVLARLRDAWQRGGATDALWRIYGRLRRGR